MSSKKISKTTKVRWCSPEPKITQVFMVVGSVKLEKPDISLKLSYECEKFEEAEKLMNEVVTLFPKSQVFLKKQQDDFLKEYGL